MLTTTKRLLALVVSIGLLTACQRELSEELPLQKGVFTLDINVKAVVNAAPLQFNTTYHNASQEAYSLRTFKFYVCNIGLVNADSNTVSTISKDNHFLIDAANPASMALSFQTPVNTYRAISITIGVDSARNFSGAQSGALDPAQGMFWTWNSGYIMAKVEGNSPLSNQPNNIIEYHIGGFKGPYNVAKTVVLPFPNAQKIGFVRGSTNTITVIADVDSWFGNPNPFNIATTPVCTTPGELARKIADNYAHMLSITDIVKN